MNKKNIYFVGAGGIGMAALERYFLARGYNIAGYDRTPTPLTGQLQKEGIEITFDDSPATIPQAMRSPADTLVVYTPAVPQSMPILKWFRDNGFEIVKRAALLGQITASSRSICFAGTHGKTTTSSMAAHILNTGTIGCNAFLGGILVNYGTNYLLNPSSIYSVIEADEYDRSFHQLRPYVAVITATDPDHLDIYGTPEAYREAFSQFTQLIQPGGALIVNTHATFTPRVGPDVRTYTYSRDHGDFHAAYIRRTPGHITFDIVTPRGTIRNVHLGVPVEVNIENAIAAVAAICVTGAWEPEIISQALSTYRGVERRFQLWYKEPQPSGRIIIDDYAHHPREIDTAIQSVRALYPGRHITVAFQPHLYTRTRDFATQFAQALSKADRVLMIPLYPAREQPIQGISSQTILDLVNIDDKDMISKENLIDILKKRNFDILLTMGAGDLVDMLPQIVEATRQSAPQKQ